MRVVRFILEVPGFRAQSVTLVTTLLDPQAYPAEELARLYARRWRIELWFRDIKTSMSMEALRCKSPKMLHKELEMFFIAYNLIRALMAEASAIYEVPMQRLSFKGTVDAVRQFISQHAAEAGLGTGRAADLVLAVNELATNSLLHGGGEGELLFWSDGDVAIWEVRDRGGIDDPLAGRECPGIDRVGGHGLWLVNQLCDLVQVRSFADGGAVRVHMRRR